MRIHLRLSEAINLSYDYSAMAFEQCPELICHSPT